MFTREQERHGHQDAFLYETLRPHEVFKGVQHSLALDTFVSEHFIEYRREG